MDNIKFGLKLWSKNKNFISEAKDLIANGVFQYVELMVMPGDDTSLFEEAKIPYILHIPHDEFGFNIGEKESWEKSLKILQESIKLADRVSAKYMILHPGFGEIQAAKKFLENVNDERIIIENMPAVGINNGEIIEKMIGYNPDQIKELMDRRFGFCIDFEHASKAAMNLGKDPKEFIKKFMALKPKVFHVCDGVYQPGPDQHLNIGEGEYDFNFFLDCAKGNDSRFITLETPKENYESLEQDLENLKKLKSYL